MIGQDAYARADRQVAEGDRPVGTDKAVLLGLEGHDPESVDVEAIPALLEATDPGFRPIKYAHSRPRA